MLIKTRDLTDKKLRWAVAHALGLNLDLSGWIACHQDGETYLKSIDGQLQPFHIPHYEEWWEAAGPIIERERITLRVSTMPGTAWAAFYDVPGQYHADVRERGRTALIAAMRCFVAKKLGNEVEVPDELCR